MPNISARLLALCLMFSGGALAQATQAGVPLQHRADMIARLFQMNPGGYNAIFAPSFLAKVPAAQMDSLFKSYFAKYGACTEAKLFHSDKPETGRFDCIFERGYSAPLSVAIDPGEPNLVVALVIGNAVKLSGTFDDLLSEFKALPGETSLVAMRLGEDPKPIASLNPDKAMAIGSAFKLYVLGELMRSTAAGERKWSDVVPLKPEAVSLPSGILQDWPENTPITLQSLGTLMISRSDNTAADNLILALGREKIESVQKTMGMARPEANMPFLTTLEMFKLKSSEPAAVAYLAGDSNLRRKFLTNSLGGIHRDSIRLPEKPFEIGSIEWLASANDLCRAMDWIRRQPDGPDSGDESRPRNSKERLAVRWL
jgi:Beta-lactamase enzyme family